MVKSFVSYKEDNGKIVRGYFEIKEETINYIKLLSGNNEVTIPYHRLLKLKKEIKKEVK